MRQSQYSIHTCIDGRPCPKTVQGEGRMSVFGEDRNGLQLGKEEKSSGELCTDKGDQATGERLILAAYWGVRMVSR